MEDNELYHWGIMGMKWGVRRYQNPDGTLTPAGRKRYAKSARDMTDEELVSAINRLANEKRYVDLVRSMETDNRSAKNTAVKAAKGTAKVLGTVLQPFGKAYLYGAEKALTKMIDARFKSDEDVRLDQLKKSNEWMRTDIESEKLADEKRRIEIGRRDDGTTRYYDNKDNGNKDGNKNDGSNNDSNKRSRKNQHKIPSLMDRLMADSDDVTLAELKAFDYT